MGKKKQVMLPANEVDLTVVKYQPEKIEGLYFIFFAMMKLAV